MTLSTKPYKGTRDFYPEDMRLRSWMFSKMREVCESYGYEEYDAPVLEPMEIYAAKTSEEIVSEQTYSFIDRGDRKVVMRPEMTPSVSRMVAGRRQELGYPLRLFNIANFFRYERPQKGRLREFWQLNADIFGVDGVEADIEIIQIADSILKVFGAKAGSYEIRINSRQMLDIKIKASGPKKELSEVVSFLDKKNKMPEDEFFSKLPEYVTSVGPMKEWLSSASEGDMGAEISAFKKSLESVGVSNVIIDPSVTRGFDYYTDIVFEVFDKNPENNRSLFGGGRYDGLVGGFGVEPVPTVGFGMGDVTLENFLRSNNLIPDSVSKPATDLVLIGIGVDAGKLSDIAKNLRNSGVNVAVDYTDRKIDKQIKAAEKLGVENVLFIGEEELKANKYKLKNLKTSAESPLTIQEIAGKLLA